MAEKGVITMALFLVRNNAELVAAAAAATSGDTINLGEGTAFNAASSTDITIAAGVTVIGSLAELSNYRLIITNGTEAVPTTITGSIEIDVTDLGDITSGISGPIEVVSSGAGGDGWTNVDGLTVTGAPNGTKANSVTLRVSDSQNFKGTWSNCDINNGGGDLFSLKPSAGDGEYDIYFVDGVLNTQGPDTTDNCATPHGTGTLTVRRTTITGRAGGRSVEQEAGETARLILEDCTVNDASGDAGAETHRINIARRCTLNLSNLTLEGPNAELSDCTINGMTDASSDQMLRINTQAGSGVVQIHRNRFNHGGASSARYIYADAAINMTGNILQGQPDYSGTVSTIDWIELGDADNADCIINHNTIDGDRARTGIYGRSGYGGTITISNNLFTARSSASVPLRFDAAGATVTATYNAMQNSGIGNGVDTSSNNIFSIGIPTNEYVDDANGDYTPRTDSDAYLAASDGLNIGAVQPSGVLFGTGMGEVLEVDGLRHDALESTGTLRHGLVTDEYTTGDATVTQLRPGMTTGGQLRPGLLNPDGTLKPGIKP